jgi:metal-sulfur cluster biosynthetic enzyme
VNILSDIYDPEIPINIYDLGLVRKINVDDIKKVIEVDLIFTAGNKCTLLDIIVVQVKYKIKRAFPDYEVIVNVDRNAKWSLSMVTYQGKLLLEEIYGKEVIEKLMKEYSRVEELIRFRIPKEEIDPKEYMRKIIEQRYSEFKEWLNKNKLL